MTSPTPSPTQIPAATASPAPSPRPVTVITGASRGIGAAIARALALAGHDLFLTYHERVQSAEEVAQQCRELGATVTIAQYDFADLDAAEALWSDALTLFPRITGLVNNAGITGRIGSFLEVDRTETERVFRMNVLAPMLISQQALRHMSTECGGAGGAIVNISSGAATSGAPHTYIPYSMSKAAINMLSLGTAREFAQCGVRVNTVSPGTTDTEIHAAAGRPNAIHERASRIPMGRAGRVEEIAGAVVYLLGPDASYTSGADIRITGAN